jgi:CRISPR-associated protein Csd1
MRQLDAANENAAYQCGRLLAELERIQRRALGRVNTTLVDRFYGAASSTPAAVFGQMLGDANKAHLPKIRKQNEGAFNAMQNSLANILQNMEHFPPTLTLQEQSMFALGYYHQRAENLKNVREYRESQEQNDDSSEKEEK